MVLFLIFSSITDISMIDFNFCYPLHQNHVRLRAIRMKNQPAGQMSDGQASYFMPYRLSTVLASNVTAATRVNALPCNVAPVVNVIA